MADAAFTLRNPRYDLIRKIGEGGMSEVFLAFDKDARREVALKVMRPPRPNDSEDMQEIITRFLLEVDIGKQLRHYNIIQFYDYFTEDDRHLISMEYVSGGSLRRRIHDQKHRFSSKEVCTIGRVITSALIAAHDIGVIHRDLKPNNILMTEDDEVRISDFGIARLKIGSRIRPDRMDITQYGHIPGTRQYMAPELFEPGYEADERCDVWSLGIVFYEMLTGEVPFTGTTPKEIALQVCRAPLPPLGSRVANLWPALETIIGRMLEKDPNKRYRNMRPVTDALDQALYDREQATSALQRVIKVLEPARDGRSSSTPLSPGPAASSTEYAASHALLIAPRPMVREGMPSTPDMRASVQALEALLRQRYQFRVNSLVGKAATLSAILQGLNELQIASQPEDRLLIYYAGPACTRRDRQGHEISYLAAQDTRWRDWNTFLELERLLDVRFLNARHVFFILDTPTRGPMDIATSSGELFTVDQAMQNPALHLLCAGLFPFPPIAKGTLFTQAILDGLEGQAQEDGLISAETLGRYVLEEMQRHTGLDHSPIYARLPGGERGCMLFLVPPTAHLPRIVLDEVRHEDPKVRRGAIRTLHAYAAEPDSASQRNAATQQLEHLARNDPDRRVRSEAQNVLNDLNARTSTQTTSPPPSPPSDFDLD